MACEQTLGMGQKGRDRYAEGVHRMSGAMYCWSVLRQPLPRAGILPRLPLHTTKVLRRFVAARIIHHIVGKKCVLCLLRNCCVQLFACDLEPLFMPACIN